MRGPISRTGGPPRALELDTARCNDRRGSGISAVEVKVARLRDAAGRLDFEEFFQAEYRGLVRALYVLTADRTEAGGMNESCGCGTW